MESAKALVIETYDGLKTPLLKMASFHCLGVRPCLKMTLRMKLCLLMQQKAPLNAPKKTKTLLLRQKEKTYAKNANHRK
jgi:hypothetical protein